MNVEEPEKQPVDPAGIVFDVFPLSLADEDREKLMKTNLERDGFSPPQVGRLNFIRWLYLNGRLVSSGKDNNLLYS